MADLRPTDATDRGQIILIAGFALALAFVGLALIMNSVVFTENLATRSEPVAGSDATTARTEMETGVESLIDYVNENNASDATSYGDLRTHLRRGVGNLSKLSQRHQVRNSGVVNVSLVDIDRGTWINQSSQRNFTNATHGAGATNENDWTLVNESDGVRSFRMNVSNLADLGDTSDPTSDNFTVVASNGSEQWRMEVFHDDARNLNGNDVYAVNVTERDGETTTCTVNASRNDDFWVNVSEGTVDGEDCTGLAFGDQEWTVNNVSYLDAEQVNGTYRLIVDKERGAVDSDWEYESDPDQPHLDYALYGATIDIVYETPKVVYEARVRAEPGSKTKLQRDTYLGGGWVRYDGKLVFAHDETPSVETLHEVNWDVGTGDGSNEIGNSLDFVTVEYSSTPTTPVDLSNVDHEDVRIYIDRDDDPELEVNATDDIESDEPTVTNSGKQISFELGNGPDIQERDTIIVVYRDVVNPSESDPNVDVEVNGDDVGSGDETQSGTLEID